MKDEPTIKDYVELIRIYDRILERTEDESIKSLYNTLIETAEMDLLQMAHNPEVMIT